VDRSVAPTRGLTVVLQIGGRRSQSMDYLITIRFEHDTVELTHEGTLSSALKAAWSVCKDRKAEPAHITCLRANAEIERDEDGWETVSPIARAQ